VSQWRGVHHTEVRGAVLGLLLVWDTTMGAVRRSGDELCAPQVEALRRALIRTRDIDPGVDFPPPDGPRPAGDGDRPGREDVPATAPPRERVYALYDACLDFLGVFLEPYEREPEPRQAWNRAGRRVRDAILNRPFERLPRHWTGPAR
jgi:hypothetical protein